MSSDTKQKPSVKGVAANLNREMELPPEIINLLKMMGVPIPENIKEITTETVVDESARTITIPKSMSKLEASKELERQYENEEQLIDMDVMFDEWHWKDVLIGVKKVTEETFGWMNAMGGYFSSPTELDIVVDIKDGKRITDKAFMGKFKITTWDKANAQLGVNRGGIAFLSINVKRKYSQEVTAYFNSIREYLSNFSIYKGKSIVVTAGAHDDVDFEIIENKGSSLIVLNEDEQNVIDTFVLGSLDEPTKRTYLFTGDYGNGKTEVAMMIGREAVQKGISFFYLKDATLFDKVLNKLKQYSPAVLFVEDIDEIAGTEDRDAKMNKILNTLDGVQTKGNALTTIFTTNHIDRINTALRRPGRIDLIIRFQNPNKVAVKQIYDLYFKKLKGYADLDLDKITEKTPDAQGAVIAEIAKRVVKLHNKQGHISTENALACIVSMEYHIEVMNDDPTSVTKEKLFYDAFKGLVIEGYNEA